MPPTTHEFGSSALRGDGRRTKLHPSASRGRFTRARQIGFAALLALYIAAPLVSMGGHPLIHLDVAARRFFLFGATFNAQDFWLVLLLATTALFALVFATAWVGRVWCGWACPQTVFLEGLYRPIERYFEGPAERRRKASSAPSSWRSVTRKVAKHAVFVVLSISLSQVALAMFLSARDLTGMILDGPFAHPGAFAWSMAIAGALYFNFAWFREQLCLVVCPYGRLQAALVDRDSLIVGYDTLRGDPRAHLFKADLARQAGDCVDCHRCVQVCPTGIDIRNGLQMECIACARCVDACDEVMIKVGMPVGLIRYDSLNGLERRPKRVARGRLFAYGVLLLVSAAALASGLLLRTPFEANLLRAPGVPWLVEGQTVRNHFELHLVNKNSTASTFDISAPNASDFSVVISQSSVSLAPLQDVRIPVFVSRAAQPFAGEVVFQVRDSTSLQHRELAAQFLGPKATGP